MDHPPAASGPVTIYSVAEQAGVSIATVSRVLSGQSPVSDTARDKVLAAVRDLNYVPQNSARSLASRRHHAYALVIGALTGPYYSELIMGFEEAATGYGQSVLLMVAGPRKDPLQDLAELRGRVDGVLVAHFSAPAQSLAELGARLPVVAVGRDPIPGCDLVGSENAGSGAAITRHLISLGRTKLIYVGDPDGSTDVRDRYRGFVEAHREAGLRPRKATLRVPQTEEGGASVVDRIHRRLATIDGLVCANDELALAIMDGLRRRGVVLPDQLAVVGWDDVSAARYVVPGLTTVRQPVREMGRAAAELLQARAEGAAPQQPRILPTEAIIRESCGAVPTGKRKRS
ncbi:LacI family DNA-binding transcriptional regulator [Microlunatus speluncae]|uniref:LacI family DNA-binding transcriptional regulator n=1 Tax=Microlunatus speluncae TaxID=2594267 RepID=UPI0012665E07|nr:LacI family DNA-binding transcriptional regulator [Microlunatus speluncae]